MVTDPDLSPYRPGFSQTPPVLAGRDNVLVAARRAIAAVSKAHRTDRPLVLVGVRGMGKTVLLHAVAERAAVELGAVHLHVQVTPGQPLLHEVAREAEDLARLVEEVPAKEGWHLSQAVVRAQVAGVGGELRFDRRTTRPAPVDIFPSLARLAELVRARESGFVLTIDEVQVAMQERAAAEDLARLCACLQVGTSRDWPVVTAFAGLPGMWVSSSDQHGLTYLERGHWLEVGLLSPTDSLVALAEPAKRAGRPFEPTAAAFLADAAGGYPYAVQVYGEHAWWASEGAGSIGRQAAEQALVEGRKDLEAGLYSARWTEASGREHEYMVAVAELGARGIRPTGGAVARHLGTTTTVVSQFRDRLLAKGTLLDEGEDRALRFTVPGMAEYVLRQARAELRSGPSGSSPGQARRRRSTPDKPAWRPSKRGSARGDDFGR